MYAPALLVSTMERNNEQVQAARQGTAQQSSVGVVLQNGLEVLPALAPTVFGVESDDGDDH